MLLLMTYVCTGLDLWSKEFWEKFFSKILINLKSLAVTLTRTSNFSLVAFSSLSLGGEYMYSKTLSSLIFPVQTSLLVNK